MVSYVIACSKTLYRKKILRVVYIQVGAVSDNEDLKYALAVLALQVFATRSNIYNKQFSLCNVGLLPQKHNCYNVMPVLPGNIRL